MMKLSSLILYITCVCNSCHNYYSFLFEMNHQLDIEKIRLYSLFGTKYNSTQLGFFSGYRLVYQLGYFVQIPYPTAGLAITQP